MLLNTVGFLKYRIPLYTLAFRDVLHVHLHAYQVLMYLDKTVGQLVDYLEETGWLDNSVIVVASDNGGCPPDGGSNLPLRGVKGSYWEGGVKVKNEEKGPEKKPPSRRYLLFFFFFVFVITVVEI